MDKDVVITGCRSLLRRPFQECLHHKEQYQQHSYHRQNPNEVAYWAASGGTAVIGAEFGHSCKVTIQAHAAFPSFVSASYL
jgi:hypothetical protein